MRACVPSLTTQGGSLLLEVLISILIFSFAILGLVGLQAKAFGYAGDAEDRNRVASLADQMVAVMWANQSTDTSALGSLYTGWQTLVVASLPPYTSPDVSATVSAADVNGVVTVTITWKPVDNNGGSRTYLTKVVMP